MSRKDYRLIAMAFAERIKLAETFNDTKAARLTHFREIANTIAECMCKDNPNFRWNEFMTACGFKG